MAHTPELCKDAGGASLDANINMLMINLHFTRCLYPRTCNFTLFSGENSAHPFPDQNGRWEPPRNESGTLFTCLINKVRQGSRRLPSHDKSCRSLCDWRAARDPRAECTRRCGQKPPGVKNPGEFGMLPHSGPNASPSCSVTDLPGHLG